MWSAKESQERLNNPTALMLMAILLGKNLSTNKAYILPLPLVSAMFHLCQLCLVQTPWLNAYFVHPFAAIFQIQPLTPILICIMTSKDLRFEIVCSEKMWMSDVVGCAIIKIKRELRVDS